ncbi:MAG: hypothetical protein M3Z37_07195, partial [Candidatus Eremiobacteraeota bacterium]|nr:hypothetical protein [Candidatus Eremiobacteraeota bacterium]
MASVREIRFASPRGGRIHAEIVAPLHPAASQGGVLFVHWLGDAKTTDLTEFYPDALRLARHRIVSLLVDAQWAQPHWYEKIRSPRTDYA